MLDILEDIHIDGSETKDGTFWKANGLATVFQAEALVITGQ